MQQEYPILYAYPVRIAGGDTNYVFEDSASGLAYRLTYSSGDKAYLRKAASVDSLNSMAAYTETVHEKYESTTWELTDKIDPIIFFEQILEAIPLADFKPIFIEGPDLGHTDYMARCRGNRNNPNNQGAVISCLHATAAARCGGTNSYTVNGSPNVNPNTGNGSMSYDCID